MILVIGIIILFTFTQKKADLKEANLREKCCQECINTYLKFGQHVATTPGCVPSKMSGECIIYLNLQNYFVPPFDKGDDSIGAYNSCKKKRNYPR